MTIGVYMIKNKINEKVYVGSSGSSIEERFRSHMNSLRRGDHHSRHLQKAFLKYGEHNFTLEIIEDLTINIDSLSEDNRRKIIIEREQIYIDKYESYNQKKGYNVNPSADSRAGARLTDETKNKLRLLKLGSKQSKEQKIKHSKRMSGAGNPMFGKKFSEEHRRKIGEKSQGRECSEETRRKISMKNQGENASTAKINDNTAREIKLMLLKGISTVDISKTLNVSKQIIKNIKNGLTWVHVEVEGFDEIVNRKKNRLDTDKINTIKVMILAGKTVREITSELKTHPRNIAKVRKIINEEGL